MATASGYYPIPQDLVWEIRSADIFTGELRSSAGDKTISELEQMGLVERGSHHLSMAGMAVRTWLFVATSRAADEIERLMRSARG